MISVSVSETNLWPLAMRAFLRAEVVFDDAVVDDDERAAAVAVGMGIFFGGAAVGGPAGVADAEGAVDGGVGDGDFEVAELAGGSAEGEAFGATGDGDAGGVVAAVFEAAEAFNDDGDDRLRSDVTDDSTHGLSLVGYGDFWAGMAVRLLGYVGCFAGICLVGVESLDAMVVAAPVDDALFDGFWFEVLGEGFADEGWEFGVGCEAEGDELFEGELVDVRAVFGGQECGEAQALFEADDTILNGNSAAASDACHDEEDDGHDDPPEVEAPVRWPVMDGGVDGDDEVEQKQRHNDEMKERIPARVIAEVLWSGHRSPLWMRCDDGPQHTIWGRLERWRRH